MARAFSISARALVLVAEDHEDVGAVEPRLRVRRVEGELVLERRERRLVRGPGAAVVVQAHADHPQVDPHVPVSGQSFVAFAKRPSARVHSLSVTANWASLTRLAASSRSSLVISLPVAAREGEHCGEQQDRSLPHHRSGGTVEMASSIVDRPSFTLSRLSW